MRFVDLFAGLGGFHLALSELGHKCVFASEIDEELANLYEKNFGIRPAGDIKKHYQDIPPHDILCAGFPCQPFSKAGSQMGFDCPQWGDLFDYVIKILNHRKPKFILIENVPNILAHNNGNTWKKIKRRLGNAGYEVDAAKLSPHKFGVPQIRQRALIVGKRNNLDNFSWPQTTHAEQDLSIYSILEKNPKNAKMLTPEFKNYIRAWKKFMRLIPKTEEMPSFPIWAMEFGATYPLNSKTPHKQKAIDLHPFKGAFGKSLKGKSKQEIMDALPNYARDTTIVFPQWKIDIIEKNRKFYREHKKIIKPWLPSIQDFSPSFQKLEWNWKGGPKNIDKGLLQFRASGIRVKRPTAAPSLVALAASQVPVIPAKNRHLTVRECARLQSMNKIKFLPTSQSKAHKALGNAVNVKVIKMVAEQLLSTRKNKRISEQLKRKQYA